jgi:hypothetical protein
MFEGNPVKTNSSVGTVLSRFLLSCLPSALPKLLLTLLSCFLSIKYSLFCDSILSIFLTPLAFPLSFAIQSSYNRREAALAEMAAFRGAAMSLHLFFRDAAEALALPQVAARTSLTAVMDTRDAVEGFLQEADAERRAPLLAEVYSAFSRLSESNSAFYAVGGAGPGVSSRLLSALQVMLVSFEKVRAHREYRSPRSLYSFAFLASYLLPVMIAPFCANIARSFGSWAGYYFALLTVSVFSALHQVMVGLDDPFDGIGEDDITLDLFSVYLRKTFSERQGPGSTQV